MTELERLKARIAELERGKRTAPYNKGKHYRTKAQILDELASADSLYRKELAIERDAKTRKLSARAEVARLLTEARKKHIPAQDIGKALGGIGTTSVYSRVKTARRRRRKRK
jgi:hypothetical protein